jgi:dTDP-4-dehydrorhamnose 3,5-epimerase
LRCAVRSIKSRKLAIRGGGAFMEVYALDIPDVKLIKLRRHEDARGFFSEIFNRAALAEIGIRGEFVQDNFSLSSSVGTVRGLHFQLPPAAQAKLVMVLSGRVLDVAVDCRKASSSFGRHVAVELAAESWSQLFVPIGFAHGFCTLQDHTAVMYKVTAPYAPHLDSGILWSDPDLDIAWPVTPDQVVISDKDRRLPRLRDLADHFSCMVAT